MGPNALTFILKLQDMLTPGMKAAAGASESAGGKIKSQFTGIEYSGKRLGSSVNELKTNLDALNQIRMGTTIKKEFQDATTAAKVLQRQIEKLEGSSKEKTSGGFTIGKGIVSNLLSGGISQLAGMAKSGLTAIVGASVQEEQAKVGLKTFLGAQGADEAYKNIKQDAAITPFDTKSLLESNRALISAGASAKDARQDTLNLANAVAAVGGTNDVLSRMATNMQQVKTVGKATAMDIKQFAFAGINIYKLLADTTGKSIDQVKEMDVSYELLSKSLAHAASAGGAYFGAMEAQSKTVGGKWSTFMDNVANTAADIGTALQPIFHWVLDAGISITSNFASILPYLQPVIDLVNTLPAIIGNLTSGTSEWSAYFDVVKSIGMSLWATIFSLYQNIRAIVIGVVDWMGKSELMKDIFWAIGKISEGVLATIRGIGNALVWIWDTLIRPLLDAIDWIYSKVKGLIGGKTEIVVTDGTPQVAKFKDYGAVLPGMAAVDPNIANLPKGGGAPAGKQSIEPAKQRSESINQGGQRSIVINIGKQIEKLEQHIIGGGREAADEIENAVKEAMKRVVYSLNGIAS